MLHLKFSRWPTLGAVVAAATLFTGTSAAQSVNVSGQASAVRAVVMGAVKTLADTGTLADPSAPRGAGQTVGSIPGLLGAEVLNAVTMGWTDQVVSQASLAGLSVILNEQVRSAGGIVVNALRVRTLDGTIDVVIGSAAAGI